MRTGPRWPRSSTSTAAHRSPHCSARTRPPSSRRCTTSRNASAPRSTWRGYRFGSGEYRYFASPFPEPVERLRQALYPRLLPIARDWYARLGRDAEWPDTLDEWLAVCHDAGQTRPTPILLRYRAGDWNALHRDLYGEKVFPLQVVVNLNEPGVDHTGGEFLLVEQRPRAQSRGTARLIPHGHGLVFTTRDRPVRSARGWSAAPVRHGVSTIRSGQRHTLGLVFHDAT